MPDAQAHPQPHVQSKKAHELVTTGSPHIPAFPARLVLTVSFVLSPVIGRFVTVAPEKRQLLRSVTPASRRQDHTTSPSDLLAFVWRNKPSIASRSPTFVTIAKRPSYRARDARKGAGDLPDVTSKSVCDQLARRANHFALSAIRIVNLLRAGRLDQLLCLQICLRAEASNSSESLGWLFFTALDKRTAPTIPLSNATARCLASRLSPSIQPANISR
jgi:hypothetical protein